MTVKQPKYHIGVHHNGEHINIVRDDNGLCGTLISTVLPDAVKIAQKMCDRLNAKEKAREPEYIIDKTDETVDILRAFYAVAIPNAVEIAQSICDEPTKGGE